MKRRWIIFSLLTLFLLGAASGCTSILYDDYDEEYWEGEDIEGVETSSKEVEEMKEKVREVSKAVKKSETNLVILADDMDDIQYRMTEEKKSFRALWEKSEQYRPSEKSASPEKIRALRKQIKVLENDVEWLKSKDR